MKLKYTYDILQYMSIIGISILCYGNSLNGDFVFDDSVAIVNNSDVTNLNKTIANIFKHDFWGIDITDNSSHKSYRPIVILTFRLEYYLYNGLNSFYMKTLNLTIHIIICCGLLKFFDIIFSKNKLNNSVKFIATILFVIHPIHTEVVSGIVGRAELLCALFYILAISLFINITKGHNNTSKFGFGIFKITIKYFLLIALCCLAILCKETGIMILPLCLSYDIIYNTNLIHLLHYNLRKKPMNLHKISKRFIILSNVTIILIILRLKIIHFEGPKFKIMDNPIAADASIITRILSQNFLYSINLWLLICPDWLSFDWALGSVALVTTINDMRIFSIMQMYILFSYIILYGTRNMLFGFALIIIPFIPASGLIRVGFVIAERVLYLPSIGFCILIAIGIEKLYYNLYYLKYLWYLLFGTLFVTMILKTYVRANEWKTEQTLFRSAIRVCPNNAKIFYNIARLATDLNDRKSAFHNYHIAIRLYPEYESALMNLGNLYREEKKLKLAEKYLLRSLNALNEFPAAWMNLGIVQANMGKYKDALISYNNALKYRRKYDNCYYNMGLLYIEMENKEMAMKSWLEAISINPYNSKAWANILTLSDNNGEMDNLLEMSEKALTYLPNDAAIYFLRANAFGKIENYEKAEQHYQRAIEINPNYPLYYVNFGILYHRWNKHSDAIEMYEIALQIDPNFKSAKDNLFKLKNIVK